MEENNEVIEVNDEISVEGNDTVKIANEAVATYAGIAISEVQGVYGMSGGFAGITEAISGKKNFSKGIKTFPSLSIRPNDVYGAWPIPSFNIGVEIILPFFKVPFSIEKYVLPSSVLRGETSAFLQSLTISILSLSKIFLTSCGDKTLSFTSLTPTKVSSQFFTIIT